MKVHSQLASAIFGVAVGASFLFTAAPAHAEPETEGDAPTSPLAPDFKLALSVEPGLAIALADPQADRTEAGLGQTLKLLFGVTRYLEVGPTAAFTTLPSQAPTSSGSERTWAVGGGARLMRPHDSLGFYGLSPWVDADLLYVRAGGADRAAFATGAGLALPLDDERRFWIGPYARYLQILQPDANDSKVLELGVMLEVGFGRADKSARTVVAIVPTPPPQVALDRDHDGVTDDVDHCPDVPGPAANAGCPVYASVVVKPDRLELKDRIAFEWNSAILEAASRPLLDEVARALADHPTFSIQVDGHASSEGREAHNQTLSEARAGAVLDYLVAHGIAAARLESKGFGSTEPVETNTTVQGRVANRRVEFLVDIVAIAP